MALEKTLLAVSPIAFTANGTSLGEVIVSDTVNFLDKQLVYIKSNTQPEIQLQIKRVLSSTQLIVGPVGGSLTIGNYSDISAYLVSDSAIIGAPEQPKNVQPPDPQHYFAVYESSPVNADRIVPVDPYGEMYGPGNPIPVSFSSAFPNTVEIKGSPSGDLLNVNADGSLNVNIITTVPSNQTPKILYNETPSVPSGTTTTLLTYTVPLSTTTYLQKVMVSGENVARFDVLIGSNSIATKRTWWANFNVDFDFSPTDILGYPLTAGTVVKINVLQNSDSTATFDSTLQIVETT
jgi:hypothetical protein